MWKQTHANGSGSEISLYNWEPWFSTDLCPARTGHTKSPRRCHNSTAKLLRCGHRNSKGYGHWLHWKPQKWMLWRNHRNQRSQSGGKLLKGQPITKGNGACQKGSIFGQCKHEGTRIRRASLQRSVIKTSWCIQHGQFRHWVCNKFWAHHQNKEWGANLQETVPNPRSTQITPWDPNQGMVGNGTHSTKQVQI